MGKKNTLFIDSKILLQQTLDDLKFLLLFLPEFLDGLDDLVYNAWIRELIVNCQHLHAQPRNRGNLQLKYHRAGPPHRQESSVKYDA